MLTLHEGQSFGYGGTPANAFGVVLPDAGTAVVEPIVANPVGSAGAANAAPGVLPGVRAGAGRGMSNAVVISGAHTTTGNPIAAFGPQAGYFAPQLLMLQELRGPGIHARGVSFSGLNFYVQTGRGPDYSWSATSSHQDITDTYAVELCDPSGAAPTVDADHYRFRAECVPMEKLVKRDAWRSSVADPTPDGSYELVAWRTT